MAMTPKAYPLLCRAIEDGISAGWNRAHKHTDHPGEAAIKQEIELAILNEICEWFAIDSCPE